MPFSRVHAARLPFWAAAALPVIVAAWLRVRGNGELEAFVDEGANILTALDPRVRDAFEPLAQGRPWLVYLFKPAGWFESHALVVARSMSAGAGLITLGALGWTLHRLAGRTAALCGLWLWALLPIAVFHERLALQDPFVAALLASALAFLAVGAPTVENSSGGWAFFAAGVCFGSAFLLKISAVFALPWLGIFFIAMQRRAGARVFDRRLGWLALGALVPLLSLGFSVRQLGSGLERYGALAGAGGTPAGPLFFERLGTWMEFYYGYGGWPLPLLLVPALLAAARFRHGLALGGAMGWVGSLLVSGLFYHNLYARYLLPDHLPLVLFLAFSWGALLDRAGRFRVVVLAVALVAAGRWGFVAQSLGRTPEQAAVPASEVEQYFTGPWSGRGLNDVRSFLTAYADQHTTRCLVLTHRFLRPGSYGLLLTELGDPRIGVVPMTIYEPGELAAALPGLRRATVGQRVAFFLLYEGSLYPAHPWLDAAGSPVRRVFEAPRGAGEKFTLYQFEVGGAAAPPARL